MPPGYLAGHSAHSLHLGAATWVCYCLRTVYCLQRTFLRFLAPRRSAGCLIPTFLLLPAVPGSSGYAVLRGGMPWFLPLVDTATGLLHHNATFLPLRLPLWLRCRVLLMVHTCATLLRFCWCRLLPALPTIDWYSSLCRTL